MSRALGLVSGGLDSSLALLTLKRQGIEVAGVAFVTPFFDAEKAIRSAELLDFPLIIENISGVHLEMVKNPQYGYGRNMNPCIDCHAMMFRLAGEIMEREGFDFLFSGEVLGQRPMSQNANALRSVAKLCGSPELVLRPLSAKLLPITPMEERGLVDREQLLDIQGRSRKPQQALAKEWGLEEYPPSAGGCLLTEEGFSNQLRDLLDHNPLADSADVELLKAGRQFRISDKVKLIVGRHHADNESLKELGRPQHIQMRCRNFSGPLALLVGTPETSELEAAAGIIASYGKGKNEAQVEVLCVTEEGESSCTVAPMPRDKSLEMLIR